jgi:hypothetical protein
MLEKHIPVKILLGAIILMALPYLIHYARPSPNQTSKLGRPSGDEPLDLDKLIRRVKQELAATEQEMVTNHEAPLFELKQFDLELSFVLRARSLANGKVEYVPVVVSSELEVGSERIQKITLHMNAISPVSGSSSIIRGRPLNERGAELIGESPKKREKP